MSSPWRSHAALCWLLRKCRECKRGEAHCLSDLGSGFSSRCEGASCHGLVPRTVKCPLNDYLILVLVLDVDLQQHCSAALLLEVDVNRYRVIT